MQSRITCTVEILGVTILLLVAAPFLILNNTYSDPQRDEISDTRYKGAPSKLLALRRRSACSPRKRRPMNSAPAQPLHQRMHTGVPVPSNNPPVCTVLISHLPGWDSYISREFAHTQHTLLTYHFVRYVHLHLATSNWTHSLAQACDGRVPHAVLGWEIGVNLVRELARIRELHGTRVVFFVDDIHRWKQDQHDELQKIISLVDVVMTPYSYLLDVYFPAASKTTQRIWLPHAAHTMYAGAEMLNLNAETKGLLVGAVNHVYPCRQLAAYYCKDHPDQCVHISHPGYSDVKKDAALHQDFARLLAKHKFAFTSGGGTYLIAKHFEMAAVGTVFITSSDLVSALEALGYKKDVHFISTECTPLAVNTTFASTFALAQKDELSSMARASRQLTLEHHTTAHRAHQIAAALTHFGGHSLDRSQWAPFDDSAVARQINVKELDVLGVRGQELQRQTPSS